MQVAIHFVPNLNSELRYDDADDDESTCFVCTLTLNSHTFLCCDCMLCFSVLCTVLGSKTRVTFWSKSPVTRYYLPEVKL